MKLLIVEDHAESRCELIRLCQGEHYHVETVASYIAAREKLSHHNYDCVLLDLNVLNGTRVPLVDQLKSAGGNGGVIVLSSNDSLEDRIQSLSQWADDFVIRPLQFNELNARIQAVIRRKKFKTSKQIVVGNVEIDLTNTSVVVGNQHVSITRTEFDLLQHLVANKNRVISKKEIAEYVWGDHLGSLESYDFLFVHIKNLKKKLKATGASLGIRSVYGIGYQIHEA